MPAPITMELSSLQQPETLDGVQNGVGQYEAVIE
jgi:hypothetical protein